MTPPKWRNPRWILRQLLIGAELTVMILMLLLVMVLMLHAQAAHAEEAPAAGQVAVAPCDSRSTVCYDVESYVLGLRAWSPDSSEPRDLAGARGQIGLRYRSLWLGGRLDATATAGQYRAGDLTTVQAVEAHVAGEWVVLRLPGGISAGPAAAVGGAVAIERKDGVRASLPRAITAVLGLRAAWPEGWVQAGVGAVQEFGRGVGAKASWQIKATDRTANVGTVSYGRRLVDGKSRADWFAWVGVAVRVSK